MRTALEVMLMCGFFTMSSGEDCSTSRLFNSCSDIWTGPAGNCAIGGGILLTALVKTVSSLLRTRGRTPKKRPPAMSKSKTMNVMRLLIKHPLPRRRGLASFCVLVNIFPPKSGLFDELYDGGGDCVVGVVGVGCDCG